MQYSEKTLFGKDVTRGKLGSKDALKRVLDKRKNDDVQPRKHIPVEEWLKQREPTTELVGETGDSTYTFTFEGRKDLPVILDHYNQVLLYPCDVDKEPYHSQQIIDLLDELNEASYESLVDVMELANVAYILPVKE